MNEYKKKLAAMQAGQVNKDSSESDIPASINGIPNSALVSVFEGRSKATSQMMGHRVNLAESINAKMQQAFGMDISGLRIYRSEAMKGTGMHGMAQGNTIVLGSDVNLNTTEGQAVLGHEISHIHAQRQGVGMGRGGLYKNVGLEHQADVEGMRAARGRPIYSNGMEFSDGMKYGLGMKGVDGLGPMSEGLGPVAAAPMQAKKDDKDAPNSTELSEKYKDAPFQNKSDILKYIEANDKATTWKRAYRGLGETPDITNSGLIKEIPVGRTDVMPKTGEIAGENQREIDPRYTPKDEVMRQKKMRELTAYNKH